jgi:hypothetical protein
MSRGMMLQLLIQELLLLGHPYALYNCQNSTQQKQNQTKTISEKVSEQLLFLVCLNFTKEFIYILFLLQGIE